MYVIKLKTILIYAVAVALVAAVLSLIPGRAEEGGEVQLPIIMYHSICGDGEKQSKFVISRGELERDLEYISRSGYTTVGSAEVIDFVENGTPLPEKPVMLTFDDGYYNNYCYAYPLLEEYNMKAVISIIGKYTDMYSEIDENNPAYSHITWEQAREMVESGLVEIQNHSYDSHTTDKGRNGTKKMKGESEAAYAGYMQSDIGRLQDEIEQNLGYRPLVFAYPFGSVSEASYDILEGMGFKMTLSCEEKVNRLTVGNAECLFMMDRFLRSDKRSAEAILR